MTYAINKIKKKQKKNQRKCVLSRSQKCKRQSKYLLQTGQTSSPVYRHSSEIVEGQRQISRRSEQYLYRIVCLFKKSGVIGKCALKKSHVCALCSASVWQTVTKTTSAKNITRKQLLRDIHEKIQHKVNRKRVLSKLLLAAFYNDKQIQNVTENKARIRSPLTEF